MGPLRTYTLGVSILLLILLEEATVHASLGLGSCKLFCEKYRPLRGDASCKDTTTGSCKVTCGDDRGCDDSCFFDCDCSGFIGSKSYDCPDPSAPEPPSRAAKDLNSAASTAGSALGLIVGIVVGVLLLITCIIVAACVYCCWKKKKQAQNMAANPGQTAKSMTKSAVPSNKSEANKSEA